MIISHLVATFLNFLYGPLAGFYDLVSYTVSFGRWKRWIYTIEPYIKGKSVLELGFGPGHLLTFLSAHNYSIFGIDASRQMSLQAHQKLFKQGQCNSSILRGYSQALPIVRRSMDTVVATFPSSYIFDTSTQNEIRRVLKEGGTLLILFAAFPRSDSFPARILALLYRLTGETPASRSALEDKIRAHFQEAGMPGSFQWIREKYSDLMLFITR